jgi:hypothetical protein
MMLTDGNVRVFDEVVAEVSRLDNELTPGNIVVLNVPIVSFAVDTEQNGLEKKKKKKKRGKKWKNLRTNSHLTDEKKKK